MEKRITAAAFTTEVTKLMTSSFLLISLRCLNILSPTPVPSNCLYTLYCKLHL